MTKKTDIKNGRPWKKISSYNTFREADEKRKELVDLAKADGSEPIEIKIHRAGIDGMEFVVKFRYKKTTSRKRTTPKGQSNLKGAKSEKE